MSVLTDTICFDPDTNQHIITYNDAGNSNHGTAVLAAISGTDVTFGTPVVFEAAEINNNGVAYDTNSNKFVITYRDVGDSSYGKAIVGTVSGTSISFGTASSDTLNIGTPIPGGMGVDTLNLDFSGIAGTQYDDNKYYVDGYDPYPTVGSLKPQPNLKYKSQKYGEDKGIADLKDYVSSTYQGHYTNENSDVQTLDLIHSVGDAESFCRSNALKYLSRYDKKGQAKRDILKAMHYCLLLYYFSGNTNDETPTRGYETF